MSTIAKARRLREKAEKAGAADLPENLAELTGYQDFTSLHTQLRQSFKRFTSLVVHRRFGKTVMAIHYMLDRAWHCPFKEGQYAYCCKTLKDARRIAWKYLLDFTKDIPGREISKTHLEVTIPTFAGGKATITLYGLDQHTQIRGIYLDGVIFDEWALMNASVWPEQIRPMLADNVRRGEDRYGRPNQWAIFIFTPFGRNHAHKMHRNAELWSAGSAVRVVDPDTGESSSIYENDWFAATYSARETGILSEDELQKIRRHEIANNGSDAKFRQEFLVSFDASVSGSIYGETIELVKAAGRIGQVPFVPGYPVHVAADLGWDDATAFWFIQIFGQTVHWINWHEYRHGSLTQFRDTLIEIANEFGYRYGNIWTPHDVLNTELGPGLSRKDQLAELGVYVKVVPKVRNKPDIYPIVRRLLLRSRFDEANCAAGLDYLALHHRGYDEENAVYTERGIHDHTSHTCDAAGTAALGLGGDVEQHDSDYIEKNLPQMEAEL